MTRVLYCKLLADCRVFLGVICLLLLAFEMLWAHVTWRITGDVLKQLEKVKVSSEVLKQLENVKVSPDVLKQLENVKVSPDVVREIIFTGSGETLQVLIGGKGIRIEHAQDMMSVGFVEPLALIILGIWAIGRSAAAVVGEIDRGTMELLLAQPIRRTQVILANLLVDLTAIPLVCASLYAGMWLGTRLVGLQHESDDNLRVDPIHYLPGLMSVAALIWAINGYTLLMSAAGRFRGQVQGFAVIVTLVQFLVNVIGQLWQPMEWMRPCTVFYYYQPQPMALRDEWASQPENWLHLGVLLAVGAAGYLLAWWTFCKRDMPAPL
jgi:ABC-2 type transport system permease protein